MTTYTVIHPHTHVGRVVAHVTPDGTTEHFFVPVDAPYRSFRASRSSIESVDEGRIDLSSLAGRFVSITGLRHDGWITGVISLQPMPERTSLEAAAPERVPSCPAGVADEAPVPREVTLHDVRAQECVPG